MIASPLTLKRLADRKLSRWGLFPRLRGDVPFICQSQKIYLNLGDFFTVVELDSEIKILSPHESVSSVLQNRIVRGADPFSKYQAHLDGIKKEKDYATSEKGEEFEEVVRDLQKIQVQVQ